MMSTTPLGSTCTHERVPSRASGVPTRRRAIHFLRWAAVCLISTSEAQISEMSVSAAGLRKSAYSAAWMAGRLAPSQSLSCRRRARRAATSSARRAGARWRSASNWA